MATAGQRPAGTVVLPGGRRVVLCLSQGVHRPSAFTQLLIDSIPDVAGLDVIDAGSGAGAVTIALLLRGAASVVALELDPEAIADTITNVERYADPTRLRTVAGMFSVLSVLPADLVVANPPQRPRYVADQADGIGDGGIDGLDPLREILYRASAPVVISTLSSLTLADPSQMARELGYRAALVAERQVEHDPAWAAAGDLATAMARVWRFVNRSATGSRLRGAAPRKR